MPVLLLHVIPEPDAGGLWGWIRNSPMSIWGLHVCVVGLRVLGWACLQGGREQVSPHSGRSTRALRALLIKLRGTLSLGVCPSGLTLLAAD